VDALASLDCDDVGADRFDPQRGGDPGDDVFGWQMAVQQQHLNCSLGAFGVAELAAGGAPERVVPA
jgi:hypothetical protein